MQFYASAIGLKNRGKLFLTLPMITCIIFHASTVVGLGSKQYWIPLPVYQRVKLSGPNLFAHRQRLANEYAVSPTKLL